MADERDQLIDKLVLTREPTEEEKERDLRVAKRRELLDHVDHLIRPPGWFYRQLENAIELAAEGRLDEPSEFDGERRTVSDVIGSWELEDLVERAREGTWGAEPAW